MLARVRSWLVGKPRDIEDPKLFHQISLVAFLAWIGLGSDGLSSSAYGPDEAFKALGEHTELAIFLAIATAVTVFIISYSYSQIIEHFPSGGGGYVVATKLLGANAGLVSGCALLIDYVLTITVSVASGAEAVFAFLPEHWGHARIAVECLTIVTLVILNIRGIKESIQVLIPIFLLFLVTHAAMLIVAFVKHFSDIPVHVQDVAHRLHGSYSNMGFIALFLIFARAYSQGAGTFTGIEAVSNGLAIMREPKVQTGKRTMVYMAISLAVTASGILLAYMLCDVKVINPERPLNAVLLESLVGNNSGFHWFVVVTLFAEAALLVIAAQTGFIGGPRTMANMALDSWLPHRFSSLSERLTTHYGVTLIGILALAALFYTQGSVKMLVVMYSINVFITFSLAQLGMCKFFITHRDKLDNWKSSLAIQGTGLILCTGILIMVIVEKFLNGAWVTLAVTSLLIFICITIRRYYKKVYSKLGVLPMNIETPKDAPPNPKLDHLDIHKPTAVLLVGSYGGLGLHSFVQIRRLFPDYYKQIIFVSVSVVDSGNFKGSDEIESLKQQTQDSLDKYVAVAKQFGMAADSMTLTANEPVEGAAEICTEIALRYPHSTFFAGKLVFQQETWFQRLLHNETAIAIQNRLQWLGYAMIILPIRIWGAGKANVELPLLSIEKSEMVE
jgi:amino acid transporter